VGGGDRLRLFVAFPLPEETVERLVAWQREALDVPPGTRLVPPGNLHVTVAFLGAQPAEAVDGIVDALVDAAAEPEPLELEVGGYRETPRVGMLVLAERGGRHAAAILASSVHARLGDLGVYEPEKRAWTPHVTVVRFRERPRLAPPLPDLGPICPSEVALYHSVLRPSGAQYEIVESVALGG
jgi:2'-5' RNA ligase